MLGKLSLAQARLIARKPSDSTGKGPGEQCGRTGGGNKKARGEETRKSDLERARQVGFRSIYIRTHKHPAVDQ